ncbi:MAG: hypothetical protein RJB39_80 [Candidatus Parcubacteria bacterium]|jgi:hypothetical protein
MKKWISNILIAVNVIQIIWILILLVVYGWYVYMPYLVIHGIFIILSIIGFLSTGGFGRTSKLTFFLLVLPLVYCGATLYFIVGYKMGFIY